jgi:hypothetical protein
MNKGIHMKLALLFSITLIFATMPSFSQQPRPEDRLYSVPDINGRATLLNKPVLSGEAMIENDGKTFTLKVVVDTDGNVISAKCSAACPSAVAASAEAAAMASKFRPLIVGGRAVRYDGILMYTIAVGRVNWYRFGAALYSTYIFDNISLGPVAAMLTSEFADERSRLHDLDKGVELAIRWKTIESVRDSIKGKLKGTDDWWFTLGIAIRKVSAPFQSNRKLDREELQKAISNLATFVETAPNDIPADLINNLKAASMYKIDPEMSNQALYQTVIKLVSKVHPDIQPTQN